MSLKKQLEVVDKMDSEVERNVVSIGLVLDDGKVVVKNVGLSLTVTDDGKQLQANIVGVPTEHLGDWVTSAIGALQNIQEQIDEKQIKETIGEETIENMKKQMNK